ncbi:MAG TPA: hypothetical protein VM553_09250 [Dongiaceae bacterium]|nr:hypothetical protein [Dongiaceae bacterium]
MKINTEKLRHSSETPFLLIDFLMLGLVILNLTWLVFDSLFASRLVRKFLEWLSADFTQFYAENVHTNFVVYDLFFVAIFLSEFLMRWVVAIHRKTYHRWFFFPFIHWYDLIGCIPVASFRWLRLLRIISIIYRLQKYQIIDVSDWYIVRFAKKYFNIMLEELSDKIVINVLDGVQEEIAVGTPVVERIIQQVVVPNKSLLVDWIVSRINEVSDDVYQPRRMDIKVYLDEVIANSIAKDSKVVVLEKLPVIGDAIADVIESTVSDVVFNVVDRLISDVGHEDTETWVREVTDLIVARLLQPNEDFQAISRNMLIEIIEVVKDEVRIQRWKLKEAEPR